jgi:hypothetical protein
MINIGTTSKWQKNSSVLKGNPKYFNFAKLWILQFCEFIALTFNLQLGSSQLQNCYPSNCLSNAIFHAINLRCFDPCFLNFNGLHWSCKFDFWPFFCLYINEVQISKWIILESQQMCLNPKIFSQTPLSSML